MSVDSLLDTNILVYSLDLDHPKKRQQAKDLIEGGIGGDQCCISQQVIQETLNVATRKLGYSKEAANALLLETLMPLYRPISVPALYQRGLEIRFRYNYRFYDSLIAAAALELDCETLYSEDMQHGQKIGQLTIKNPFLQVGLEAV